MTAREPMVVGVDGRNGQVVGGQNGQLLVSHVTTADGGHALVLDGELDYQTAPQLIAVLDEVAVTDGAAVDLDLDLSAVPFCDSAGIAALLRAHYLATLSGGKLRIVAIDPRLTRTLELCGLADLFAPG